MQLSRVINITNEKMKIIQNLHKVEFVYSPLLLCAVRFVFHGISEKGLFIALRNNISVLCVNFEVVS